MLHTRSRVLKQARHASVKQLIKEKGLSLIHISSAFRKWWWKIALGALAVLLIAAAPAHMSSHFMVFVLACVVGFYVITGVSHTLHTPLMSETNAISGIIIVGALLQISSGDLLLSLIHI